MKKTGILNSDISRVLSYMGHMDLICIGDCGLPIPDDVERIDLALTFGVPTFMQVLEEISKDMVIESYIVAEEIKEKNKGQYENIKNIMKTQEKLQEEQCVSHEQFKKKMQRCKAVIRTGETTPYSNIILQAGCIF